MRFIATYIACAIAVKYNFIVSTLDHCQLSPSVHVEFMRKSLVQVNTNHALDLPSLRDPQSLDEIFLVLCCAVILVRLKFLLCPGSKYRSEHIQTSNKVISKEN